MHDYIHARVHDIHLYGLEQAIVLAVLRDALPHFPMGEKNQPGPTLHGLCNHMPFFGREKIRNLLRKLHCSHAICINNTEAITTGEPMVIRIPGVAQLHNVSIHERRGGKR